MDNVRTADLQHQYTAARCLHRDGVCESVFVSSIIQPYQTPLAATARASAPGGRSAGVGGRGPPHPQVKRRASRSLGGGGGGGGGGGHHTLMLSAGAGEGLVNFFVTSSLRLAAMSIRSGPILLPYTLLRPRVYPIFYNNKLITRPYPRGELSYLAPLGSENISAPYSSSVSFGGGWGITPQTVKHHASQSQDRNNKYFILYLNFASIIKFKM